MKELLKNRPGISNNEQVLAYAQHYGKHSTLIDFTFNPLVALYFATAKNAAEYTDSELQYYFSVIELTETTMFANWEKALDVALGDFLSDEDDRPEKIEAFKSAIGNSVVEELQKINNPVWIAETEGREISNPRMRAQEGAFLYQCKHANVPFEAEVKAIKNDPLKKDMIQIRYVLISRKLFLKVRDILDDFRINAQTLLLEGNQGWVEAQHLSDLKCFVRQPKSINLINDALYFLQLNPCPQSLNLFCHALFWAKIYDLDSVTEDIEWESCSWYTDSYEGPSLADKIRFQLQYGISDAILGERVRDIIQLSNKTENFLLELQDYASRSYDENKMMSVNTLKHDFKCIIQHVQTCLEFQREINKAVNDVLYDALDNEIHNIIANGDPCFSNGSNFGQIEDACDYTFEIISSYANCLMIKVYGSLSIIPLSEIHAPCPISSSHEFSCSFKISFENDKIECQQLQNMHIN